MDADAPPLRRAVAVTLLVVAAAAVGGSAATATTASNLHGGYVDPGTVEENSTVEHTISFAVDNVSADGDTDRFYVIFPDDVEMSPDHVMVTDRSNGRMIRVTSSPEVVDGPDQDGVEDTLTFAISPDGEDPVDVRVRLSNTVTWPDLASTRDVQVEGSVEDSSGENVEPTLVDTVTVRDSGESGTTTTTETQTTVTTTRTTATETQTTRTTATTTETTVTSTATPSDTVETSATTNQTAAVTGVDEEGTAGTPGFGVGAAVAGLTAGGLLARRRN
ncbi:PGF-CTERM sorting domain-containing protein [Haloarchaeobius sp. TZWWS8]|uniref:PGF-CTERM sorting domain-containing protein n=1 Tax=Haloarchaeobius sp. TZWWS8 TaxID=3446121 RepID=UPI003EBB599A